MSSADKPQICPNCKTGVLKHIEAGLSLVIECSRCGQIGVTSNMRLLWHMGRDNEHNPDPNANAARIVAASTAAQEKAAPDLESAWAAWSSDIQNVDERAFALLRAAFEAGWESSRPRP